MEEQRHRLIQKKYFDSFDWSKNKDVYNFLFHSVVNDIPVYLSIHSETTQVFVASILVPTSNLQQNKDSLKENLEDWSINVTAGHGYGYGYDGDQAIEPHLYPPFSDPREEILTNSVPIFFLRHSPLKKEDSAYIELNQQISHPHDLHYDSDLNSYIRLNELGDPEEVVKIVLNDRGYLITIDEKVLNFHCHLGKYTHIRFFHFTRIMGTRTEVEQFEDDVDLWNKDLIIGKAGNDNPYTFLRGFQILPQTLTEKQFLDILLDKEDRQYCSFLIQDWKNKRIVEWTSNPSKLGNYFTKSDLPFETSPAFFKKEVLKKYKDNPDKYEISSGRIECRGAWGMPYSINEADQVSSYIIDLSHLPYKEQLHWEVFNEKPKAPISETAYKRDFEGQWVDDDDPLIDLKNELEEDISIGSHIIWHAPLPDEISRVTYLTSENQKEWENDFSLLNKVIIESFKESKIRKAISKSVQLDEKEKKQISEMKSLKLIEFYLRKSSNDEEIIETIINPLFEINYIRRKISDHKPGSEARAKIKDIKHTFGTFMVHHKNTIVRLRDSMRTLRRVLEKEN